MTNMRLYEWHIAAEEDRDGRLHIYVTNDNSRTVFSVPTNKGNGADWEQLAFCVTTPETEKEYENHERDYGG